jgi:hypothetical protein
VFSNNVKNKTPKLLGMLKDHENSVFVYVGSFEAQIDSVSVRPQDKQQRGKNKKRSKRVGVYPRSRRNGCRGLQEVAFDDPHEAT